MSSEQISGEHCLIGKDNQRRIKHLEDWQRTQNGKLEEIRKEQQTIRQNMDKRPPWAVTVVIVVLSNAVTGMLVAFISSLL